MKTTRSIHVIALSIAIISSINLGCKTQKNVESIGYKNPEKVVKTDEEIFDAFKHKQSDWMKINVKGDSTWALVYKGHGETASKSGAVDNANRDGRKKAAQYIKTVFKAKTEETINESTSIGDSRKAQLIEVTTKTIDEYSDIDLEKIQAWKENLLMEKKDQNGYTIFAEYETLVYIESRNLELYNEGILSELDNNELVRNLKSVELMNAIKKKTREGMFQ